jgi:class 3 adenylate cyclase
MSTMRDLPTGILTFLFTDVEGSTKLIDEFGEERYEQALADHRSKLREAFARHGGVEVDTQGDAFFYAFADASEALAAAAQAQTALAEGPVKVRIGLHTGESRLGKEGYVGVARLWHVAPKGRSTNLRPSTALAAALPARGRRMKSGPNG